MIDSIAELEKILSNDETKTQGFEIYLPLMVTSCYINASKYSSVTIREYEGEHLENIKAKYF